MDRSAFCDRAACSGSPDQLDVRGPQIEPIGVNVLPRGARRHLAICTDSPILRKQAFADRHDMWVQLSVVGKRSIFPEVPFELQQRV